MTDFTPNDASARVGTENLRDAYCSALKRYDAARLRAILATLGCPDRGGKASEIADEIADRLAEPRVADGLVARLGTGSRLALSLMATTESPVWPALGLVHSLGCLGAEPAPALTGLLEFGLLAARVGPDQPGVVDFAKLLQSQSKLESGADLVAHPAALGASRTTLPEGAAPMRAGTVHQIREADGLEPILRLAALWQRVGEGPLRQTQSGSIFKRDRDRLMDDPALAGPIADALAPLPDMVPLWIELALALGLLNQEAGSDRALAAPAEFWAENAVHLPQMVATRWLSLRTWHERYGMQEDGNPAPLALPYVRPAVLLWLARLDEGEWLALDDLVDHLNELQPDWGRRTLAEPTPTPTKRRMKPARGKTAEAERTLSERADLEAILLGPAYQLGLIRAAEETQSGRRVVQLTPLGRYVLALGPPPPARAVAEQFLFVQPNFEVVAYRQGLNASLIGEFSRFARWSQVGAALELKLTSESVYRGLEGGLSTAEMLDRLGCHSARPLPAGVAEALRTWAERRERITYYASATLMEFASPEALQLALACWPATSQAAPVPVSDRLLLVEDESAIPFKQFRMIGARDYRRPTEKCLDVESDGLTLTLELGRSDLLVNAELARFSDELPAGEPHSAASDPRRRFRVSRASLARGFENGLSRAILVHWFRKRTGADLPPALRLLMYAAGPSCTPLRADRSVVLKTPTAELLDGLLQHLATRDHLGERLGPTTIAVPDESLPALQRALTELGLALELSDLTAAPARSISPHEHL